MGEYTRKLPPTTTITTSETDENGQLYPIFGTKAVQITATLGSTSKNATLNVKGLQLAIDVLIPANRGFVKPGERFKAKLRLDRPPKTPIKIELESTDRRALTVPRSITIGPGQQEYLVDVSVGNGIRANRSVQIKGWLGQDRSRQPVEASLRIQPGSRR